MANWEFPCEFALWISSLAESLHGRSSWRLAPLMMGVLFAQGRRTVASWLRAAGLSDDFRGYYYFLGSLGRNTDWVAARLLGLVRERLLVGDRILLAIDDSPTKRYGPMVEGAGVHHNPTPGPADAKFLYGHVWVTLAWIARHRSWGSIALPLLAKLYVRAKDVAKIVPWYHWTFQTKLEQAAELVEWAVCRLYWTAKRIWVVVDGAYAKRPFLKRALAAGVVVVSRLRKDAALCDLPPQHKPGERRGRGAPRKYGVHRISLAKRAGQKRGWQTEEFALRGRRVHKTFKTFPATYRPVGGTIRVVLVREDDGWVAYFCTDPAATTAEILEAVTDRWSIEQAFHDIKEVHGAGQQQVRNLWANIAVFHLTLWVHTLIELWAWNQSHAQLCDRRTSPWDDPTRRPSHADRRNALRRRCLETEFSRLTAILPTKRKINQLLKRLTAMVV
jgi:hypothetical protein